MASLRNSSDAQGQASLLTPHDLLKKLFEGESGSWKLIGRDGSFFNFHPDILDIQVPRLRAGMSTSTSEQDRKEIKLPDELDMKAAAVEAFLRYLYYQDLEGARSSFGVTSSLILAGHFYGLPKLVEDLIEVVKGFQREEGQWEWFNGQDLWKLYQGVRLWEPSFAKRELIKCIIHAFKNFSTDERKKAEMLPIVGGNEAGWDLVLALFGETSQQSGHGQRHNKSGSRSKEKNAKPSQAPVIAS